MPISIARAVFLLTVVAALVRVAVLIGSHFMLMHIEPNSDFLYYNIMVNHPWMLVTGTNANQMETGGIYAPLIPLQMLVPGWVFIHFFGVSLGQRAGMACYDVVAISLTLYLAFQLWGTPANRWQWLSALLLTVIPGSIGASCIWGQEDTIWALWSAIVVYVWWRYGSPNAGFTVGIGLFTSKIFAVLALIGVIIGSPGRRIRTIATGATSVTIFFAFLLLRRWISGFFMPSYRYDNISNSPSLYAIWELTGHPMLYDDVRVPVLLIWTTSTLALTAVAWRLKENVPCALLAVHLVFVLTFLGVQPEHYQSFAPMLMILAWYLTKDHSTSAGRRVLQFALCWFFGGIAYCYKMAYGLAETSGDSQRHNVREWFSNHFFAITPSMLIGLAAATILCCFGLLLITFTHWNRSVVIHPAGAFEPDRSIYATKKTER